MWSMDRGEVVMLQLQGTRGWITSLNTTFGQQEFTASCSLVKASIIKRFEFEKILFKEFLALGSKQCFDSILAQGLCQLVRAPC